MIERRRRVCNSFDVLDVGGELWDITELAKHLRRERESEWVDRTKVKGLWVSQDSDLPDI